MSKETKCKKVYVLADGTETRSAHPDTERLELRFAGGETLIVQLDAIDAYCLKAAGWHGASHKISDAYANTLQTGLNPYDEAVKMYERLCDGDWVMKGDGTSVMRPTLAVEAIVRALESRGETVDDDRREAIKAKVSDAGDRKIILADPMVKAALEEIKAERAAKRAEKAQDAANELGDEYTVLSQF